MLIVHRSLLFGIMEKVIDTMSQTTISSKQKDNVLVVSPSTFTDSTGRTFSAMHFGSLKYKHAGMIYEALHTRNEDHPARYRLMTAHWGEMTPVEYELSGDEGPGDGVSYEFKPHHPSTSFGMLDTREVGIVLSTYLYHGVAANLADVHKA